MTTLQQALCIELLSRVYYLTNARTGTSFLIQRAFETFFVGALSQPIVAKQPPSGPGWAHELKHDGYRYCFKKLKE
jgi:ATP-dependent DNA ligase